MRTPDEIRALWADGQTITLTDAELDALKADMPPSVCAVWLTAETYRMLMDYAERSASTPNDAADEMVRSFLDAELEAACYRQEQTKAGALE